MQFGVRPAVRYHVSNRILVKSYGAHFIQCKEQQRSPAFYLTKTNTWDSQNQSWKQVSQEQQGCFSQFLSPQVTLGVLMAAATPSPDTLSPFFFSQQCVFYGTDGKSSRKKDSEDSFKKLALCKRRIIVKLVSKNLAAIYSKILREQMIIVLKMLYISFMHSGKMHFSSFIQSIMWEQALCCQGLSCCM